MMTEEEMRNFVNRYHWTFAKTYAKFAPHEYYNKNKMDAQGKEDFVRFVTQLRKIGFDAYFGRDIPKNHQLYIKFDGHYYWTMGAPVEETYILNRSNADEYMIMSDRKMVYKGNRKRYVSGE